MAELNDTQLKEGAELIICCPFCGNGLTNPTTKGNLKLNLPHKCVGCGQGFSVRLEKET